MSGRKSQSDSSQDPQKWGRCPPFGRRSAEASGAPATAGARHGRFTVGARLSCLAVGMRLSTRNQLAGTVESVDTGGVMATVKVTLAGGEEVTASITREAVEELGLAAGRPVTVLVKSTEVMLAVDD